MTIWQNLTDLTSNDAVCTEMVKKFKNTFLGISNGESKIYAYFTGVEFPYYHFKDAYNSNVRLTDDTSYEIFIPTIQRGLYNCVSSKTGMETGAFYVQRNPLRQWKRGVSYENHRATELSRNIMHMPTGNQFNDVFYSLMSPKYYDLFAALNRVSKFGTVAMTHEFGITLSPQNNKDIHLVYHENIIGDIKDGVVIIKNPIYYQEAMDTREEWCPAEFKITLG